jgi:transcription elongation factor GreA
MSVANGKKIYLTKDGVKKLEEKLEYLKTTRRQEVADRIREAIALGDLSENSEYDDAKNEQAFVEGEIASIEHTLRHAEIITEEGIGTGGSVSVGSLVKLKNRATGAELQYTIVGSDEADPFKGRISNESPIGAALMTKKTGDIVEVEVPGGKRQLEIISINR